MEAAKLKRKKGVVNKGQVKKNIKNVVCRPDPVIWPEVSEDDGNSLCSLLKTYSVDIPDFKKPHWNKLKSIPKNKRPKPEPIKKIEGLLFGISVCKTAVANSECSAIIIEALMEPQIIAQSIIEACISSDIPVICLKNLRIYTKKNFGIQTSCLGIKKDNFLEVCNNVKEIYEKYKPKIKKLPNIILENLSTERKEIINKDDTQMEIDTKSSYNPYLFRADKKTRVFVPSNQPGKLENNQFVGQNYIKITTESNQNKSDSKKYMNMVLKKISSNPSRVKIK